MFQVLTPGKNLWHKIRVSTCTHCPTNQDRNQFNIYSMLWQEMHPHWFITLPWVSSCLQIVIQSPALTILKASSFLIYSWAINISLHKNSHHTSGWTLIIFLSNIAKSNWKRFFIFLTNIISAGRYRVGITTFRYYITTKMKFFCLPFLFLYFI